MNKKTLTLVIILVLIAAGLIYAKTRVGNKMTAGPGEQSQSMVETYGEATELAMAMKDGKPVMCKLTKGTNYMDYYIEGGKMRMDGYTTVTSDGTSSTQVSHMINDSEYMYIWTDGSGTAIKMKAPTEKDTEAMKMEAKKYTSQAPKLESEDDYRALESQGYTVNCEAVGSNAGQFIPPSDVTFTDIAAMTQAIPSPATGMGMSQEQIQQLQQQYGSMGQ